MTRISIFWVVTSALAALALAVGAADATKVEFHPVIVPTPKVTVKPPPPIVLQGRKNIEWTPTAVKGIRKPGGSNDASSPKLF
jgi:hypothetical protein